ncbi:MAG: aspartate [Prolixibacteraceae bacterium]|nr:MAG: aspartate [Prolixibacteraceae bacterium]
MYDRIIRFGGSYIGYIDSVCSLIVYLQKNPGRAFVVVSAIPELLEWIEQNLEQIFHSQPATEELNEKLVSFFTDRVGKKQTTNFQYLSEQLVNLLKGIALIGDFSPALKDQVVTFAEKLSIEILLAQLKRTGSEPRAISPEELGLIATSDFGNATFVSVNNAFISSLPESVYLVPGSYGITENGKVVRTGKTAADYTAAFLTAQLNTQKLELWGLDLDFYKADPKIVKNPPLIERLTYSEASELAYFDHYSFHPRTVEPLEHRHIPIQVLNTLANPGKVDTIINTETFVDDKIVKSVACSDDISLLKLDGPGVGLKPGILARVTTALNDAGINIKSVITSQISINLILERATGEKALKLIQKLGFSSVKEIHLVKDVSLIGVIGHGMQQNYGVSAKIFTAVAQNKINVVLSGSGASDLVSYLVVKSDDKEKSVQSIYNAFFEAPSSLPKVGGV